MATALRESHSPRGAVGDGRVFVSRRIDQQIGGGLSGLVLFVSSVSAT
jgi:hypothetical protein